MKKKLELYFFPQCPYCQRVLSTLRQTGLENEVVYNDINDEPKYKAFLVKDTGRATVPVLYIDGKPMRESADISDWLHEYAKEVQVGQANNTGSSSAEPETES